VSACTALRHPDGPEAARLEPQSQALHEPTIDVIQLSNADADELALAHQTMTGMAQAEAAATVDLERIASPFA
jgi:hypothetical protein